MALVRSKVIEPLTTGSTLLFGFYVAQLFEKFNDTLTLPFSTGTIGVWSIHQESTRYESILIATSGLVGTQSYRPESW